MARVSETATLKEKILEEFPLRKRWCGIASIVTSGAISDTRTTAGVLEKVWKRQATRTTAKLLVSTNKRVEEGRAIIIK
jgi:hypothetical protein